MKSVLHHIYESYPFTAAFFKRTQEKGKWAIPFIQDIEGQSPLHICLEEDTENSRNVEFFLGRMLIDMPFGHCANAIEETLPICIEKDVKFIGEFIDGRYREVDQYKKVQRSSGHTLKANPHSGNNDYYVTALGVQPAVHTITEALYD